MRFFEEKVHSLSVAPKPLVVWNKELEGLESDLFEELKSSPFVAERIKMPKRGGVNWANSKFSCNNQILRIAQLTPCA